MTKIKITIESIGEIRINIKQSYLSVTIDGVFSRKSEGVDKDNTETEVSNGKHI